MLHKLQYISQGTNFEMQYLNIKNALDLGCKWIQFRYKYNTPTLVDIVKTLSNSYKIKELCDKYNATLIINDHLQIAKSIDAHGVHLGLDDISINEARSILGPNKIIGGTANTFEHIKQRCHEKVDYIGLGPYRFTNTKEKLSPILGIEGYQNIIQQMKKESLNTPIYAIGGIELQDIESIIKTGVYGIAVSGLLTNAENKEHLVKEINKILYHA